MKQRTQLQQLQQWARETGRDLVGGEAKLSILWLIRFLYVVLLTYLFVQQSEALSATLPEIQSALFILFVFVVFTGFSSVYYPSILQRQWIKLGLSLLEIGLVTWCCTLFRDAYALMALFLMPPMLIAARYLTPSAVMLVLSLAVSCAILVPIGLGAGGLQDSARWGALQAGALAVVVAVLVARNERRARALARDQRHAAEQGARDDAAPEAFSETSRLRLRHYPADIGQQLAAASDHRELLTMVVSNSDDWFMAESAAVFLLEGQRLVRKAIAGVSDDTFDEVYDIGQGAIGHIIDLQHPSYGMVRHIDQERDVQQAMREYIETYRRVLSSGGIRNVLIIPLKGKDGLLGVLRLINKLTWSSQIDPQGFHDDNVTYALAIAAVITAALDLRWQLDEMKELAEVGPRILAPPELDPTLQTIHEETIRLIPSAYKSVIHLIDPLTARLVERSLRRRDGDEPPGPPFALDQGVVGRAIQQKRTQYVADTREDKGFIPRTSTIRCIAVVPLLFGETAIGALSIVSMRPNSFSERNLATLGMLAQYASGAIRRAKLYDQALAFYKIAQSITTSLQPDDVYHGVLTELSTVVGYDNASLQILDPHRRVLEIRDSVGFAADDKLRNLAFSIDDATFPNTLVVQERRYLIVGDAWESYPHFASEAERYQTHDLHSLLIVPLLNEGTVIGMIVLGKSTRDYYTEEHAQVAQAMASIASTAIVNSDLHREVKEQRDMLRRLVSEGPHMLAIPSTPDLLRYCATFGKELFGVEDCCIYLKSEQSSSIDLVASTVIPSSEWKHGEIKVEGVGLTAYVMRTGERLNLAGHEHRDHPAWGGQEQHLHHLPSQECHSLFIGPILDSRGVPLGVIKLENRLDPHRGRRFTTFHDSLHSAFAGQLSAAIEARRRVRAALGDDMHTMANLANNIVRRAETARVLMEREHPGRALEEIRFATLTAQHMYERLKQTSRDVRDATIEDRGLLPALQHYASLLGKDGKRLTLRFVNVKHVQLPIEIEYVLYRIGQEALQNTMKHAQIADEGLVDIELGLEGSQYWFIIRDNGRVRFKPELASQKPDSLGLQAMYYQAKYLHADFDISSRESGTVITVRGSIDQVQNERAVGG